MYEDYFIRFILRLKRNKSVRTEISKESHRALNCSFKILIIILNAINRYINIIKIIKKN